MGGGGRDPRGVDIFRAGFGGGAQAALVSRAPDIDDRAAVSRGPRVLCLFVGLS